MIAPGCVKNPRGNDTTGENSDGVSGDSKHYDGDDETEFNLSDYEVVKNEPFIRVRDWLNSQNKHSLANDGCDSSDDEQDILTACRDDVRMKDYDIISVPCSGTTTNYISTTSMGYQRHGEAESMAGSEADKQEDGDSDSEFSVLHSSIGGLDWRDRDELSSSCESLHSAALFLTFDVVEMIELRYNNVVWPECVLWQNGCNGLMVP